MLHKEPIEGAKRKPRGRPFANGNKKGNAHKPILDASRHQISDEGGVIAHDQRSSIVEPLNALPVELKEDMGKLVESIKEKQEESKEVAPLEKIEDIDFFNGKNKLSIRFSKRANRMFRVQIFLNDETEIRNVTYHGSATAHSFWNMLKGALNK